MVFGDVDQNDYGCCLSSMKGTSYYNYYALTPEFDLVVITYFCLTRCEDVV